MGGCRDGGLLGLSLIPEVSAVSDCDLVGGISACQWEYIDAQMVLPSTRLQSLLTDSSVNTEVLCLEYFHLAKLVCQKEFLNKVAVLYIILLYQTRHRS